MALVRYGQVVFNFPAECEALQVSLKRPFRQENQLLADSIISELHSCLGTESD